MSKIIITGAGGFVGSELTKKMIENGIEVFAISLDFAPCFPDSPLITKIEASVEDVDKLLALLPRDDYLAVYHLAWRGVNGPEKANPFIQLDNIKNAIACASLAKQIGAKKILYSGTVAERAIESLPDLSVTSGGMLYGVSKYCNHIMIESYCKNIGLDFVWMQFSNIYGPNNKTGNLVSYTLGELFDNRTATFGPALQPYDFIFVDDLVEAVFRLGTMQTTKNFYYIGSGEPRILKEYLIEIGALCDKADLIQVGVRPDDGIHYDMDMFNNSDLVMDIGEYVSMSFSEGIKYTIENY